MPKYTDQTRLYSRDRLLQSFCAKALIGDPTVCWPWQAGFKVLGKYGAIWNGCYMEFAHRVAYRLLREEIPSGLTIDHLCRNPACVNPWHMEAVPGGVNTLRGNSVSGLHARQTHCLRGHLLSGENVRMDRGRSGLERKCRTCIRMKEAARRKLKGKRS